jgi:hypothetical protein
MYKESQHFRRNWLFFVVVMAGLIAGFPFVSPFFFDASNNKMDNETFSAILFFSLLGLSVLLYLFRLDTEISQEGISARLFPIHRKFRRFAWRDLAKIEVRQYKPLSEYGGWGIRIGRNGKAWNISGNQGIQLEFKDRKRLLIGTQNPEEVKVALEKFQVRPEDQKANNGA